MDVDALAREIADRLYRGDLAAPPFPAHYARWVEVMDARARAAGVVRPPDAAPVELAVGSVARVDIGRNGDLDSFLYRVEPGAAALLLVLRADELAYVAMAGNWFVLPEDSRSGTFPPFDLAGMALCARAEGELDIVPGGWAALRDGSPVSVSFELARTRYDALGAEARSALHDACIPLARDTALLGVGRPGPLHIILIEPDGPGAAPQNAPERLIAEFEAP
jgi:hypothetical protein